MTSRTASRSSSNAVSLPIAVAVPTRVRSSGTPARSASAIRSGGASSPAGDQHARDVGRERSRERLMTYLGGQAFEEAHFALAVDEHAAGLQVLVKAGEREAGLLDVGIGDAAAARPLRPASSSMPEAERPPDARPADRRRSPPERGHERTDTVTSIAGLRRATVVGFAAARPRPVALPRRLPRSRLAASSPIAPPRPRRFRSCHLSLDRSRPGASIFATASVAAVSHVSALAPRGGTFAARVQRDLHHLADLLGRHDHRRRDARVVDTRCTFASLRSTRFRRPGEMTRCRPVSSRRISHSDPFRRAGAQRTCGFRTAPCAGSRSGSSALRGTWRSCAAPASAPRAAGC